MGIRYLEKDCALAGERAGCNEAVKVFIQRVADQLFLKAEGVWVSAKEEALAFSNCTPAIDLCVERKLTDVRLWLAFEDAKYDFPMEVFRAETQTLVKFNKELREKGRMLLAQLDLAQPERKEQRKQFPFKRQELKEDRTDTSA